MTMVDIGLAAARRAVLARRIRLPAAATSTPESC